jgi:tRNA modification GTPase
MARDLLGRLPAPRRAIRARFLDRHAAALDEGLALYFPSPHSYTGEDVLELHGHGGPVVLRLLLGRCVELGARIAEPGEFTRRAFLNDKLDLAQAEAVADLIDASTEAAARCALRSLRGEFSERVRALLRELVELRMLVEATLDFPEEEIDAADRIQARARLERLRRALARALEQARRGSVLRSGLSVALIGRPNVGKSSLLNRLAGEEVVIVTPIPGTTRDAVRQSVVLEGVPVHLVDTAGLRETADPIESLGIERTWGAVSRADLALLVADAERGLQPEDEAILARLPEWLPRIVALNKIDLYGMRPSAQRVGEVREIRLSVLTGEGVDLLRAALLEAAGWQPGEENVFMARERHLAALAGAERWLSGAERQIDAPELFAEELRMAQRDLNTITGEFGADDLLGEIFSRFCIGK